MNLRVAKIKNVAELAKNNLRQAALSIAEAGLQAIDTKEAVRENVSLGPETLTIKGRILELSKINRLFVAGIGKCSLDAAQVLEEILGDKIYKGMVIDIKCDPTLKRIKSCEGDHPFPTDRNIDLTGQMIEMLKGVGEGDLVITIISGGGSTLLCQPVTHTCQDERQVLDCLFRAGANIQEINTIRKHLSLARGGFLAKHVFPAQVVSLIFSDVVGNELEYIASGPTVLDTTTVSEAEKIIDKYFVAERCGFSKDYLIETPKDKTYFEKVANILLVSNTLALSAMERGAERLGFRAILCDSCLSGDAALVGTKIVDDLHKQKSKTALLYGGETTLRIKGNGRGGRNQELALSALKGIKKGECIITLASDGRDNTEAAGAVCDILTAKKAGEKSILADDFLSQNNSFAFFESVGGHVMTGITGSNTADFVIALKE